jgi:hypothetical protein
MTKGRQRAGFGNVHPKVLSRSDLPTLESKEPDKRGRATKKLLAFPHNSRRNRLSNPSTMYIYPLKDTKAEGEGCVYFCLFYNRAISTLLAAWIHSQVTFTGHL